MLIRVGGLMPQKLKAGPPPSRQFAHISTSHYVLPTMIV